MRFSLVLGSILMTAAASGATINFFGITLVPGNPFSPVTLQSAVNGNVASITNSSVVCSNVAGCSGNVVSFILHASSLTTPTSPLLITIDGTLSGGTSSSANVALTTPVPGTTNFTITPGAFNITILSGIVPSSGSVSINGTFGLTLENGQTLTLPNSLSITMGAPVPEPGTIVLLGLGLAGIYVAARRQFKRTLAPIRRS